MRALTFEGLTVAVVGLVGADLRFVCAVPAAVPPRRCIRSSLRLARRATGRGCAAQGMTLGGGLASSRCHWRRQAGGVLLQAECMVGGGTAGWGCRGCRFDHIDGFGSVRGDATDRGWYGSG